MSFTVVATPGMSGERAREIAASFDLRALPQDFYANPYPVYACLRESQPVRRMPDGSLFLTRPTLNHYTADADALQTRASAVLGGVADGTLKVRIDREYPLPEAAEAHRALEARETAGKVLLIP